MATVVRPVLIAPYNAPMPLDPAFQSALQLYQTGHFDQAEESCRRLLEKRPDHADALQLLGLLSHRTGQADAAVELIRKAIAANPRVQEYYNNLAVILTTQGRLEEAVAAYRNALALKPDNAQCLHNLAIALRQMNRLPESLKALDQSLALKPNFAQAHHNRGKALEGLGKRAEALAAYRQALALKPDLAEAHSSLGALLVDLGQAHEAVAACSRALELDPKLADAYSNLGNALGALGRGDEALAAYQRAVELDPRNALFHYNLGIALKNAGDIEKAVAATRRAVELKDDYFQAWNNLGVLLLNMLRVETAREALERATAIKPDYAEAWSNLGLALKESGRISDALNAVRRALALNPNDASAHNNTGIILTEMARLEEAMQSHRKAVEINPDDAAMHSNLVFCFHYQRGDDGPGGLKEAKLWDSRHGQPLRNSIPPHVNNRDPDRRIRVAYITNDFLEHPINRFLQPLIQNHDHAKFEIICYCDVWNPNPATSLPRDTVDQWHEIMGMSNESLAELIRRDAIDILVDLTGHTSCNRLKAFARKPAPVQISYLGYPATTGLATIDYRLTDALADPPGMTDAFCSETLLRLPRTNWGFAPPAGAPDPPATRQARPIRFGSFNRVAKLSPQTLDLWAATLAAIPNSRLLIKDRAMEDSAIRDRIGKSFADRGIDPQRLELIGRHRGFAEHFQSYGQVDIALDTFPYHGTTTTCDALWMGVPIVTLAGKTHVARVGVSLLTNLGLGEWIAHSPDEYASIAAELARDTAGLAELRRTMRARMQASPLMDGPQFAHDVEAAYHDVWRRWCASQAAS
jgi:protein O-GlcNAc transferase